MAAVFPILEKVFQILRPCVAAGDEPIDVHSVDEILFPIKLSNRTLAAAVPVLWHSTQALSSALIELPRCVMICALTVFTESAKTAMSTKVMMNAHFLGKRTLTSYGCFPLS